LVQIPDFRLSYVSRGVTDHNNSPGKKVEKSHRYLPLLGRVLIGAPFILSGLGKLTARDVTVGYIGSVGLPFPQLAWIMAIVVEMGGGVLLTIGYRARLVALVLALFALATALSFHRNFADQNQMIHFLKNVMMAGGLLQIVYFGAGPLSVDASRSPAHS
jgi:putative oxidoreductase